MSSSTPTPDDSNFAAGLNPALAPLIATHDTEEAKISATISAKIRLHPNLLAQLDAAFLRHHWLVESTGVGELLDRHCRSSNRGRKKQGLDGALKRYDRWAMELWRRRVHQVLDLRVDKPGAMDQYGSKVIDGRPHCPGMAPHLEALTPADDPTEQAEFRNQIAYREKFALRMLKGPLASPTRTAAGEDDPKVGVTRWQCPAVVGTVGGPAAERSAPCVRAPSPWHGRSELP